jgi:6-phospho-beta-glucosidase
MELVVNTRNNGTIEELFDDDVIETNCYITKNGIKPLPYGKLPESINGIVHCIKQYERLTVKAAASSDENLAFKALLTHPLVRGYKNAQAVIDKMKNAFGEYIHL